ncbi:MAG TPA: homogentisate 1,2-dioxygenase [Polyangiaceae bacterium]|nr:homogentisate 1,2-dioxygenase [Polyangiaceae bacterium]
MHRPHALRALEAAPVDLRPDRGGAPRHDLQRRHFLSARKKHAGSVGSARTPLLYNADVTLSIVKPLHSDAVYHLNADGDELLFIREGNGTLRTPLGDLAYGPLDYVFIPKGLVHRFELTSTSHDYLGIECKHGVDLPEKFRNSSGQLRMDAPYCHRDFRRPEFRGAQDENIRVITIKRDDRHYAFASEHSPLDVVGWDGTVYPWAFPILAFQPRVSSVHLPPTWHTTFTAGGAYICSFVPRPLDFGPDAIPCPYPHSSVDVDEVLYYVSGAFTSRTGVGAGSLTLHPRGIPHGPQPGRYEESIVMSRTEELAVMIDCRAPLMVAPAACDLEDAEYDASFRGS